MLGVWLLLTALLAKTPLLAPILDPQYLGHEAREVFTHALVTFPLELNSLAALGKWVILANVAYRDLLKPKQPRTTKRHPRDFWS
jgi:hypothetical protein